MALSQADRAALRARAEGLRAEVSSLKTTASDTVDEASAAIADAKLLDEIARLEREKTLAIEQTQQASGSVADAQARMEAAAAKIDNPPDVSAAFEPEAVDVPNTEVQLDDSAAHTEPVVEETPESVEPVSGGLLIPTTPGEGA